MRRTCGITRRVEGADRLVVGGDGRVELAPDLRERLHEAPEAAVQLARGLGDLARRLGDQLLAPAVVDRPQQPDQRRRRRHQDLLLDAVLDQRGVLGEGRLVDPVGGHEHHDELGRRVELALVALGGELGDVLAGLARVAGRVHLALAPRSEASSDEQVGVERHLRVDDHELAAGQAHEHVRAAARPRRSGSCSARRSRSARPCRPSRRRCAAGSLPRSRAWWGACSAVTRLPVSWRSVPTPSLSWRTICASSPWAWRRSRSRRPISLSIRPSFSCTGATMPLISSARRGHLAAGALLLGAARLRRPAARASRRSGRVRRRRSPSAPRACARGWLASARTCTRRPGGLRRSQAAGQRLSTSVHDPFALLGQPICQPARTRRNRACSACAAPTRTDHLTFVEPVSILRTSSPGTDGGGAPYGGKNTYRRM